MALEQVRLGTPPSGSDGDDPRTAFTRINNNAKLLDDIGVSGPVSAAREVASYNDATQPGRWIGTATATSRPPGFGRANLEVALCYDGSITQEAVDIATGQRAYRGFSTTTSSWGSWIAPGSAASKDVVAGSYDTTPGRVVTTGPSGATYQPGWMGLGANELPAAASLDAIANTSFYTFNDTAVGKPPLFNYGNVLTICRGASEATQIAFSVVSPITMTRYKLNSNWSAWADASGFGVGQNWGPNLQGSRSYDTAYTNNTNRVMMVQVFAGATVGAQVGLSITTGGVSVIGPYAPAAGAYISVGPVPVAPGATYVVSQRNGTAPINTWAEFK